MSSAVIESRAWGKGFIVALVITISILGLTLLILHDFAEFNDIPNFTYDWDRHIPEEVFTKVGERILTGEYCQRYIYYSGIEYELNKTFALINYGYGWGDPVGIFANVSIGEDIELTYQTYENDIHNKRYIWYHAKAKYKLFELTENHIMLQLQEIYDIETVISIFMTTY